MRHRRTIPRRCGYPDESGLRRDKSGYARLRRDESAFTLAELLVVIGIIVLSLGVVLPGIKALFNAGADVQAIAEMSATLGSARGLAIETNSPALVHVQPGVDDKCWVAIMEYETDPTAEAYGQFVAAEGLPPRRMPGEIGFGEIGDTFVTLGDELDTYNGDPALGDTLSAQPEQGFFNFCTFNVVFAPDGSWTELINGDPPRLFLKDPLFDRTNEDARIWDTLYPPGSGQPILLEEPGARIMTVFDYRKLKVVSDPAERARLLNESGRYLCINPYTGQLIPTE